MAETTMDKGMQKIYEGMRVKHKKTFVGRIDFALNITLTGLKLMRN